MKKANPKTPVNEKVEILKSTYDFAMYEMGEVHKACDLLGVPRRNSRGDNFTASQRVRIYVSAREGMSKVVA